MKVADLAAELDIPASAVLEQCQRFGIGASWAGAELNATDVVILRAELADADEPLDLTPIESADAEATDAEPPPPAEAPPLPPTAVGSLPHLIDEITPEPEPEPVPGPGTSGEAAGGFRLAGAEGSGVEARADAGRRVPPRPVPESRPFDRSAKTAAVAFVVAVVAFGATLVVGNPWAIAGLWLVAGIALLVAIWDGNRGRRSVSTHPERRRGYWLAISMMVLAAVGLGGLGVVVAIVVSDDDPADAPLGIGDLAPVDEARWGYQRLNRIIDNGWHRPAKDAGTCWRVERDATRPDGRVEVGNRSVSCDGEHTVEVVRVFAFHRDADAPFPGPEAFALAAAERCQDIVEDLDPGGPDVQMQIEHPTADGWSRADHDVACILVGPERSGSLVE